MIIFVFDRSKVETHEAVPPMDRAPKTEIWSYDHILQQSVLPRATYIFGDFDRLNSWDCELAARLFRTLRAAGLRVLNDAARARRRFDLLSALHRRGVNDYAVWRFGSGVPAERYPVFLRTASAHRGVQGDLIHDPDTLRAGLKAMLRRGVPEWEIMIVQYAAEEVRPGLFRKLAAYRIGDRIVPALAVHDGHWCAKHGVSGIAGQELYEEERRSLDLNAHRDLLMQVFSIARIDYGRVDFAMVRGRPQIYEINTNPTIRVLTEHPFPLRVESGVVAHGLFVDALRAIDSPDRGEVAIDDKILVRQREKDAAGAVRSRWTK